MDGILKVSANTGGTKRYVESIPNVPGNLNDDALNDVNNDVNQKVNDYCNIFFEAFIVPRILPMS